MDFTRRGFLRGGLVATASAALTQREASAKTYIEPETPATPAGETAVDLACTVNGQAQKLRVDPDDDALALIRDRLGLTGSKRACGHGACGACTALVDGVPHATCLLPAVALEGRAVQTVEGLSAAGLHPVQRAFMANDALQCGFCTPGFVVEGAAFVDAWRAQRGSVAPDRDAVAAALAGHLCRCGAYPAIYRAVQQACEGRFDAADPVAPRADAREKVTGAAQYTVDVRLPGQLEGKALRSPHANAILTSLDLAPALAIPGVKAAIQITPTGGKVRYAGQEIAAVAAADDHAARRALAAIQATYDVRPAAVTPEQALAAGAPLVYEEKREKKEIPNANEGPLLKAPWDGNLRGPTDTSFFSKPLQAEQLIDEAEGSKRRFEGEFTTQHQCHTCLEPHAAVAHWEGEEKLTVYASTQGNVDLAEDVAVALDLPHGSVTVRNAYVGGGFGSKAGMAIEAKIAALLARSAGAPVRLALDRHEELMVGGFRPGTRTNLAFTLTSGGELAAVRSVTYASSGCAAGHNAGGLLRIVYPSLKSVQDYDILTHTPPGKPFRGPGGPPAFFAMEQLLDSAAVARGEDPIALRRRIDTNPIRRRLYDAVEALPLWKDRPAIGSETGRFRRGVGLASAAWITFVTPGTHVKIDAGPDGIVASAACQDMGNGARSVVAWTIAEELGISPGDVAVRFGDSSGVYGPMCAGSRTTPSMKPPAADAARQLRDALVDAAEDRLGLKGAEAAEGGVKHEGGFMAWADVLRKVPPITTTGRRKRDKANYLVPVTIADIRIIMEQPGAVQVTEVEVDTRLGKTQVRRVWVGIGAGKIVVPDVARSQMEGAVVQGISYALYEERRLDPSTGRLLTHGLEDYRLCGIGDVPEIQVHFDEECFQEVQGGSVGLAELSGIACAPSIANAVYAATGQRHATLPIRVDRIAGGAS